MNRKPTLRKVACGLRMGGRAAGLVTPYSAFRTPHSGRGFTLVEVLIVVTLLGILAVVAMPSMDAASSHFALESMARQVAAEMRIARQAAVQYGTSYTVTLDIPNNSYAIAHTGTASSPPLVDPLVPNEVIDGSDLDLVGSSRLGQSRVHVSGAALKVSKSSVVDVTFGQTGGTGPARSQDTVIWLTNGTGLERRCIVMTVQWITGAVIVGAVQQFPPSATQPQF